MSVPAGLEELRLRRIEEQPFGLWGAAWRPRWALPAADWWAAFQAL